MGETVGLVGLAVILAKTLEKLVDYVVTKVKGGDGKDDVSKCLDQLKTEMQEIKVILAKSDINGAPLIYFPRAIETRQIESLNLLHDQSHTQENTINALDKMADHIIDMRSKQEQILHEVRK